MILLSRPPVVYKYRKRYDHAELRMLAAQQKRNGSNRDVSDQTKGGAHWYAQWDGGTPICGFWIEIAILMGGDVKDHNLPLWSQSSD